MPRRSLRPHLNQIRGWVRQGRTDAWVAHQLEVTVQDIEQFKRQNELSSEGSPPTAQPQPTIEEIDLRAEDDALIAAELEAAEIEAERAEGRSGGERRGPRGGAWRGVGRGARRPPARRRSRRGGRGRRGGGAQRRSPGGHLRPRRGGLRPVARPRHPGQPDLRRALGRPPTGRGSGRGGPHRHPPHRRGRLERRCRASRRARRDACCVLDSSRSSIDRR